MAAQPTSEKRATAQVFYGPQSPLQLKDLALPARLEPGQVLAQILLATICGSDLHTLEGRRSAPTPCVLGHEAVGRIVALGPGRTELNLGDRITWSIADSCGTCPPCCDHHLPEKCLSLFKYGHATLDEESGLNGCYASHILLRRGTHIALLPTDLDDALAAPANCALATVVNALSHLPTPCTSALVQGAGLLGVYACALLQARGVKQVFCLDIDPKRLALISQFGGIPLNGVTDAHTHIQQTIEAAAPQGVDLVIEVAGVAALVPQGLSLVRAGGHYIFVGMVHPDSQLELSGEQIIRKCLTIRGVHNYSPHHLDEALSFLAASKDRYPYAQLVSPPLPLSQLPTAVDLARSQRYHRVSIRQENP